MPTGCGAGSARRRTKRPTTSPRDYRDAPGAAHLSDRLAQWLSAHRTAALQIEVARQLHGAAALCNGMVKLSRTDSYGDGLRSAYAFNAA